MKELKMSRLESEDLDSSKLEKLKGEASELESLVLDPTEFTAKAPSKPGQENTITVDGIDIEIKPTKLKYARNMFTAYYNYIKKVPIDTFVLVPVGTIDPKKSGDQILFDFLVAVFDDPDFVQDHYDNMDAVLIESILEIYERVNHIKEREEAARKNPEAQTTA